MFIDIIEDMIVEYENMSFENNVKYPLDSEIELRRTGHYGAIALRDLINRCKAKGWD